MRDRRGWHNRCSPQQLREVWPDSLGQFRPADLLDVELGLYLLQSATPSRTALDVWPLLGGYPYSDVFGDVRTEPQRLRLLRARHRLWDLRRRTTWLEALTSYLEVPQQLRGYDLDAPDSVPRRREPTRSSQRFEVFEEVLSQAPDFSTRTTPIADPGEYTFRVDDRMHSVVLTDDLLTGVRPLAHDLDTLPSGRGAPIEVNWTDLAKAADAMDAAEVTTTGGAPNRWRDRLERVRLLVRDEELGRFTEQGQLRIDRLLHLVGMVGAGKSTVRDILTYHVVNGEPARRVTIVVSDVAETLAVVAQFERLGVRAAPVLGQSTRERNISRLHRRTATAGAETMLGHDHPGFAYLSSACPVDALRGLEARRPLGIRQAPCTGLFTVTDTPVGDPWLDAEDPAARPAKQPKPQRRLCPLWDRCPRHRGARELVEAQVWVSTPAGLVHSSVPQHQHDEQLRYLELACRLSDLVIVDEADRVQMQLDTAFAPASTLVGRSPNSWFDEVAVHKFQQMARDGRLQLSARDVDDWSNAVNTVSAATDRLYALLVKDERLRNWISVDYFSAFTLHNLLLDSWFPGREKGQQPLPEAQVLDRALHEFRDDPLHEHPADSDDKVTPIVNTLVHLTLELLHAPHGARTRDRLRDTLENLVGRGSGALDRIDVQARRFEFTLILAALHSRLDFMTTLWPRVEAALHLENASNVLSRRPPKDYEAVIPESPMGNVLGFQFRLDDRERDGDRSGELRFFHCNGVGRELLVRLGDLCAVDGRPSPNVLLMSATSWAGTSSRYHLHTDVGAVLRPREEEVAAVLGTEFRKDFLYWPGGDRPRPLRLSGCDPEERPQALLEMLRQLAVPDRSLPGSLSMLDTELAEIEDPERRRILLLVGSYDEARLAAEFLNQVPEWNGRVTQLVSDDTDADHAWTRLPQDTTVRTLPRGDVRTFPQFGGDLLVAPLLAVERGHNIVLSSGKAAIGSVYFLARPHPRPDDISLAVQSINDWATRQLRDRDGSFRQAALAAASPDRAAVAFRSTAFRQWTRYLTRRMAWSSLREDEKTAFTWDQLVVMWQVIGRLVRGGVPARVVFVDAAFAPREAGFQATDTPDTSLLASMRAVLAPYFGEAADQDAVEPSELDQSLVQELYEPLYRALTGMA
ncbi:signal recognition particle [Kitasatospora sp. NPDC005856]|uniref:pPIWI_RE_Z domain-containing protein n=1 Tax=Kitasatospora sp. NPDC005856 TaxID=3154566 RepID=UPI0033D10FC4